MGNRSKGKNRGGASGNRNQRTKIRSSGMKQRGKGAKTNYIPTSKKGYNSNYDDKSRSSGSGK